MTIHSVTLEYLKKLLETSLGREPYLTVGSTSYLLNLSITKGSKSCSERHTGVFRFVFNFRLK